MYQHNHIQFLKSILSWLLPIAYCLLFTAYSPAQTYTRTIGKKQYELKDHLGNVAVVIKDFKEPNELNNLATGGFTANIVSCHNYYPFGMEMPGKTYSSSDYRYGYNGMEKDDELKGNGNSYTTEFRQYDARTGTWLSMDPMTAKYPEYSPYLFSANNPINLNDPTGADWKITKQEEKLPNDDRTQVTYIFTINAAILNSSSVQYDEQALRDAAEEQLEKTFWFHNVHVDRAKKERILTTVITVANIRIIDDIDELDVDNKEHLIHVVNKGDMRGSNSIGEAHLNGLIITLNVNFVDYMIGGSLTIPHEFGHSAGLQHVDADDIVFYTYGSWHFWVDARFFHDPPWNILRRSSGWVSEDPRLSQEQLVAIYRAYRSGKLNQEPLSSWLLHNMIAAKHKPKNFSMSLFKGIKGKGPWHVGRSF